MAEDLEKGVTDEEANRQLDAFIAAHKAMGEKYHAAMEKFSASHGNDVGDADAAVKGQDRPPTAAIDGIVARLQKVVGDQREKQQAEVRKAVEVMVIGIACAFVAIGVAVFFMVRSTKKEMTAIATEIAESARQTASASSQVSNSSQSLSQGSTEQAASLEETSASMEEMASMTRKNAENSRTAASLMAEVDAQVRGSNQALGEMVSSMTEIQDSSKQVAKIMKTIDEIAFQTNILALNAAVEAARAGEAGMGFAVVADEVRNLAQRSATAAKETAALIEASIAKAQAGGHKVEQVAGSITAITDGVTKVKGLVDEVSVASQQQSQGIDQVSQAIAQMEKVTQTTAATAEESAAASEELHAQAETSMSIVARLEVLVGGAGAPPDVPVVTSQAVKKAAAVVQMKPRAAKPVHSAEDELPMGDTGTFGKF
jgi:methyl-accepting chemotaxis protein/methyl-accepting chemotaxis protein-1 (serine sensor receptor)